MKAEISLRDYIYSVLHHCKNIGEKNDTINSEDIGYDVIITLKDGKVKDPPKDNEEWRKLLSCSVLPANVGKGNPNPLFYSLLAFSLIFSSKNLFAWLLYQNLPLDQVAATVDLEPINIAEFIFKYKAIKPFCYFVFGGDRFKTSPLDTNIISIPPINLRSIIEKVAKVIVDSGDYLCLLENHFTNEKSLMANLSRIIENGNINETLFLSIMDYYAISKRVLEMHNSSNELGRQVRKIQSLTEAVEKHLYMHISTENQDRLLMIAKEYGYLTIPCVDNLFLPIKRAPKLSEMANICYDNLPNITFSPSWSRKVVKALYDLRKEAYRSCDKFTREQAIKRLSSDSRKKFLRRLIGLKDTKTDMVRFIAGEKAKQLREGSPVSELAFFQPPIRLNFDLLIKGHCARLVSFAHHARERLTAIERESEKSFIAKLKCSKLHYIIETVQMQFTPGLVYSADVPSLSDFQFFQLAEAWNQLLYETYKHLFLLKNKMERRLEQYQSMNGVLYRQYQWANNLLYCLSRAFCTEHERDDKIEYAMEYFMVKVVYGDETWTIEQLENLLDCQKLRSNLPIRSFLELSSQIAAQRSGEIERRNYNFLIQFDCSEEEIDLHCRAFEKLLPMDINARIAKIVDLKHKENNKKFGQQITWIVPLKKIMPNTEKEEWIAIHISLYSKNYLLNPLAHHVGVASVTRELLSGRTYFTLEGFEDYRHQQLRMTHEFVEGDISAHAFVIRMVAKFSLAGYTLDSSVDHYLSRVLETNKRNEVIKILLRNPELRFNGLCNGLEKYPQLRRFFDLDDRELSSIAENDGYRKLAENLSSITPTKQFPASVIFLTLLYLPCIQNSEEQERSGIINAVKGKISALLAPFFSQKAQSLLDAVWTGLGSPDSIDTEGTADTIVKQILDAVADQQTFSFSR